MGEAGDGQRAVGHVISRLRFRAFHKKLGRGFVLALIIQQAAQQEGGFHGILFPGKGQDPNLGQTGGVGVPDIGSICQTEGFFIVHALLAAQVRQSIQGHGGVGVVLAELFQQSGGKGILSHGFQIENHIQHSLVGGGIQLGEEVRFLHAAQPANQIVHAILGHDTVENILSRFFVPQIPVGQSHDHRRQRMLGIPAQSQPA